jgi:tetratricopeptide (TPR) repeat protein
MDMGRVAHVEGSLVVRDLVDSLGEGTRTPLRNLKILYREARASDWQISTRQMVYLASEARAAMPEFAKRLAELCVEKSVWPEERAWASLVRGRVAEAEDDHEGAATWCQRALDHHPTRSAALGLCRACFHLRRWAEAVAARERAARIPADAQHLGAEHEDEDAARILAAASLSELGRDEEALALAREARASHPGSAGLARLASEIEARARGRGGNHV